MIPRATYRVQFHRDFPFSAAIPLADYWAELGISHLYSSPIATARSGSNHGYDVVDPSHINPELGGEEGFRALAGALKARGIGIILDIVPNHVAVGRGDNGWWLDVLEKGEASAYARWFDIDWRSCDPALDGKLIAPFLGAPYSEVLEAGDLKLEQRDGRLAVVAYGTHVFPLRPEDQQALAGSDLSRFADAGALHELCERQHWRLCWWRSAGDIINWRRFFDITELAGVRVENAAVFDALHALPLRLYAEGLIDGVRVDHIDGLADPAGYCRRLRTALEAHAAHRPADAAPGPAYVVVEKILAEGEHLLGDWPVDGTSGYDFLNDACALLHDPAAAKMLGRFWREVSGRAAAFAPEEDAARRMMVERGFAGQVATTAHAFAALAASDVATRDIAEPALRRAIGWLLESFPAYRAYSIGGVPADAADRALLDRAGRGAAERAGPVEAPLVRRLVSWLVGEGPGDPALAREAVRRFHQLSAPIAAKSVEDTAFYRYGRLLSRNDVGCDPAVLGIGPTEFATVAAERAERHPHAMLATATHDHKRGEDVRMRLAALSELPERWIEVARQLLAEAPGSVECGDAHMLHQTIIGAWPVGLAADDQAGLIAYRERLSGWWTKALREAKVRTSWACPDEGYEAACGRYLADLLAPHGAATARLQAFAASIAPAGWAKSLVQTLLRYTLPGVPDLYQGTEGGDFSLVDPDNRRPVDYARLRTLLHEGHRGGGEGADKLRLIHELLLLRSESPALFEQGTLSFRPVEGLRAGEAVAFTRSLGQQTLLVVAAVRGAAACVEASSPNPGAAWWGDTQVSVAGHEPIAIARLTGGAAFGFHRIGY